MSGEITYSWYNPSRAGSRSAVWTYFLKASDGLSGKCTLCDNIIKTAASSTQVFIRHLKNKHGIDPFAYNRRGGNDMHPQHITYADASWIQKSPDDDKCQVCILCGVILSIKEEPTHFRISGTGNIVKANHASQEDAEKKLQIFKTLCSRVDVPNRCTRHWDFRSEDLPFCRECHDAVTKIYELELQLQEIQNCLTEGAEHVKQTVMESENSFDSFENKTLLQERMLTFRSFIVKNPEKCTAEEADFRSLERPLRKRRSRKDEESIGAESCELVELSDDESENDTVSTNNSVKPTRKRRKRKQRNDVVQVGRGGEEESESDNNASASKSKIKKAKSTPPGPKNKESKITKEIWKEVVNLGEGKYKYRDMEFMIVDGVYVCTSCTDTRAYTKKYALTHHIKIVHLGLKSPHECPHCGKGFNTASSLKCHQDTHATEKSCICPECGKAISTMKNLKRHVLLIHGLQLTSTCEECNSLFKTQSDLELHMAVQHGKKTYFCDSCGKGFDDESSCNEHKKLHEKQKFFRCSYCLANFLQKPNITAHLLEKHGVDAPS